MSEILRNIELAGSGFEILIARREAAEFKRRKRQRKFAKIVLPIRLRLDDLDTRQFIGYEINGCLRIFRPTGFIVGEVRRGKVVSTGRRIKDMTRRNVHLTLQPIDSPATTVLAKFAQPRQWFEVLFLPIPSVA